MNESRRHSCPEHRSQLWRNLLFNTGNKMKSLHTPGYKIQLRKAGATTHHKLSYPLHCGIYSIIETPERIFHFNLNQEILRIQPKNCPWAHPHEWFKRTCGNDWVYYSTGGYTGVFEATGEYYLPNFSYSSNSILGGKPFNQEEIRKETVTWYDHLQLLASTAMENSSEYIDFFHNVLANGPLVLATKAKQLHDIVGGRISVLPPDARHVDYDVIPLTIAKGCLYKCRFCKVKNNHGFAELPKTAIKQQLAALRKHYGEDLHNYNSLFLGEHDALNSRSALLLHTLNEAYHDLQFAHSYMESCNFFLFGSIDSLLGTESHFFRELSTFPGKIYLNIGLESADQESLDRLGKPVSAAQVREAFRRMQELNSKYQNLELTGNFIMADDLPETHYSSIMELLRDNLPRTQPKGSIYFSPLEFSRPSRKKLFHFNRLKLASRLPTFLYLIQRL
jgi:hypothetical protein